MSSVENRSVVIFTNLPMVGGHSTIALEIAQFLLEEGVNVSLITRELPGHGYCNETHAAIVRAGGEILRIDEGGWAFRMRGWIRVLRWLRRGSLSAFLVIGMRYLSAPMAFIAGRHKAVYYHITHSGGDSGLRLLHRLAPFFGKIAVISAETQKAASGSRWLKKVEWIPQIVRLPSQRTVAQEDRWFTQFGFLGRLVDYKGIRELLILWEGLPWNAHLQILGDGPLRPLVEEAAQRDKRISYLGSFSAADRIQVLPPFFKKIDVLLVPTIGEGEGLPTVILEALSSGTPVITTPLGGTRMFVDFFEEEDLRGVLDLVPPSSLGDALVRCIRSPPDPAASARSRGFFQRHFSAERISAKWCDLLLTARP